MLKAIIVDDEEAGVEALKLLLKKKCPNVEVIATANSVSEAEEKLAGTLPDVIFLDIAMPFANGFELLKRIKNRNFSVVFTTAYNEYAVKAIKHNALDYLLKPIDADELMEAVKKCEEKKQSGSGDMQRIEQLISTLAQTQRVAKIPVPTLEEIVYIEVDGIMRMEADSNYTHIYTSDKQKLTSSKTLKEYEQMLSQQKFFRVHKTHLINLDFVEKYLKGEGGYVVMADGSSVEVSRQKKAELLALLTP
jgi:two-component system LytT family response regulator